jgi:hypothetical protein
MDALLDKPIHVSVRVSRNRVIEADLNKELSIDTSNIKKEVIAQPSRYAKWATLTDIAQRGLEMAKEELATTSHGDERYMDAVNRYMTAEKQYEFFYIVQQAFYHRMSTLLDLWANPKNKVSDEYHSSVSHLRAILEDTVPYLTPAN